MSLRTGKWRKNKSSPHSRNVDTLPGPLKKLLDQTKQLEEETGNYSVYELQGNFSGLTQKLPKVPNMISTAFKLHTKLLNILIHIKDIRSIEDPMGVVYLMH